MNTSSPHYWNEAIVVSYLEDAASIHRRLPPDRGPGGYFTLWPETLKDDWQLLYDMIHGKFCLGPPMPPEVTFHEEVMEWLRVLDRPRQQLVWMRANRVPWKILIEEFGLCKQTLYIRRKNALDKILTHLDQIDPEGEYFRRLRGRANSVTGHD